MTPNSNLDWVLRGLVVIVLLAIGIIPKFTGDPTMLANFQRWGYPDGFHYLVGAGETVAVILLLLPKTVLWGALLADGLMMGALVTHLKAGEYGFAPIPSVVAVVALVVAWPRLEALRGARAG